MPSTIATSDNDSLGHNNPVLERLMQREQEEHMDWQQRLRTASGELTRIEQNGQEVKGAVLVVARPAALDRLPAVPSLYTTQIEDFVRGRRLALQFSANGDGTLQMLKVVIDGQDRTEEALRQGGAAVRVAPAPCHLFALSRSDLGLGWEPLGKFGTWFRQAVS